MDSAALRVDSPPVRPLAGQSVAFTGRLASMTRESAVALAYEAGGQFSATVTRATTLLVVGDDGWPLGKSGRPTRSLQQARFLQQRGAAIEILGEASFLKRVGLDASLDAARQTWSLADVVQMLDISRDRVRGLIQAGLIEPVQWRSGVPFFDFRDATRLRTLLSLLESGVKLRDIRRSLQRIRSAVPGAAQSLDALGVLESWGNRVVVRSRGGELLEPAGQRLLDFEPPETAATIRIEGDLFDEAVRFEEQGDLESAVEPYEKLLLKEGPDADVCFNLGNALFALGRSEAAIERFRQAVELDPQHAEAWNNLGHLLAEARRHGQAIGAYRRAVEIDPDWPDARYGLADVLDEAGFCGEALPHWRALLALLPDGPLAQHARSRLAANVG
ncbi:MAG: tetratricopeptide repeat protein [Planctomycetia bacterium]|nr:tetratricopeptide repeat protein [Planctomycetia bacterium]